MSRSLLCLSSRQSSINTIYCQETGRMPAPFIWAPACPPLLSGRQHARPLYLGASMPAPFIWAPACPLPLRCKDTANRAKKRKKPPFSFVFSWCAPPFLRPVLASVPPLSPPCSGIGAPSFRRGLGGAPLIVPSFPCGFHPQPSALSPQPSALRSNLEIVE